MANEAIQEQLAKLTPEQKAALILSHQRTQKLVKSGVSIEEQALGIGRRKKQIGPTEAGIVQFDAVLAYLLKPDSKVCFIPFWMLEIAYEWIQELDNPFAKPWNKHQLRGHIRVWCIRNGGHWREWSKTISGGFCWMQFRSTEIRRNYQGWGKSAKRLYNADTECWPHDVMYIDKTGGTGDHYRNMNRLKDTMQDYGREHLREIFEQLGIIGDDK